MKPSLPQGTRDFGSETVRRRNYIFQTIRTVFELYGFQPLETPAFEHVETLLGKYGEEGDKLIFKILNNGLDNPAKRSLLTSEFSKVLEGKTSKIISERALRYDLTIPFARYVAMNHGQLTFPYKRYQMQPVWRADRPQKGRYREFYQCDADIVGSHSLLSDAELAQIYIDIFSRLKINVTVKINSRKILEGLSQICEAPAMFSVITVAIDKLDKIGLEKVLEELKEKGLGEKAIATITNFLNITGANEEKLLQLSTLFTNNEAGKDGINEINEVIRYTDNPLINIDLTLARGLNYYTGIIYEVSAAGVKIGSIGGGGRYDNLTGLFDAPSIPGVGISFGVDRIYDVMTELELFPSGLDVSTKVLFLNLGRNEADFSFKVLKALRQNDISCELYHENVKMDKQFKYAERKNIPYVVIVGSNEMTNKTCVVKNLETGQQNKIEITQLVHYFSDKDKITF